MEIEAIVKGFIGKRVIVIGDVMIDEYIRGKVKRLSPEVPVPLLLRPDVPPLKADLIRLGGAGNTARNIASYGGNPLLIGVCGDDFPAGRQMQELAARHEPDSQTDFAFDDGAEPFQNIEKHRLPIRCRLVVQPGLITTHKLRMINEKSAQLFRVDTEEKRELLPSTVDEVLRHFKAACEWGEIVVVTDYAKGLITPEFFHDLRKIAHAHGKRIIVDPKESEDGKKFDKYAYADIIIPNENELCKSFGKHPEGVDAFFSGALQRELNEKGIAAVICTRGAKGITYCDPKTMDRGKDVYGRKGVEVADVTGASDTVTATVALAYAQKEDLKLASELAEKAGRLKVTKPLTGTIQISELLTEIDPMFSRRAESKLYKKRIDFLAEYTKARDRQLRTALVTGCFDILHRGHLNLLEHAAQEADFVAVAVNSDDYIRRTPRKLGGPYLDEISRATLIASLACVDIVTIFDDDSPEDLIIETRPSLLVMGKEYKKLYDDKTLPGMEIILKIGAKVHFVGGKETSGWSSSAIAERIRRAGT